MYLSFAPPRIEQGVATEGQTCFTEVKLWLAAVATLTAAWSISTGGGEITPLRTLELYLNVLKHADSREFERIAGHGVVTSISDVIAEAINLRRPDCCCLSGAINIGS